MMLRKGRDEFLLGQACVCNGYSLIPVPLFPNNLMDGIERGREREMKMRLLKVRE
jgi:hypothetical protein